MEPTRYFIKGRTYAVTDPGLQDALARVYESPERPRCQCVPGGVEMYIARHADYVVKRMPDTGHQHHPTCPSFEPEPGMSGLGELVGEAIIEHTPDQVEVRTDFAMSRMPGRAVPRGEVVIDPAEVHAPRKRMSLRALLHFLYERAVTPNVRVNRPAVAGPVERGLSPPRTRRRHGDVGHGTCAEVVTPRARVVALPSACRSCLRQLPQHRVVDDRAFELHAKGDEVLGQSGHLGQRAHGLSVFQGVPDADIDHGARRFLGTDVVAQATRHSVDGRK